MLSLRESVAVSLLDSCYKSRLELAFGFPSHHSIKGKWPPSCDDSVALNVEVVRVYVLNPSSHVNVTESPRSRYSARRHYMSNCRCQQQVIAARIAAPTLLPRNTR